MDDCGACGKYHATIRPKLTKVGYASSVMRSGLAVSEKVRPTPTDNMVNSEYSLNQLSILTDDTGCNKDLRTFRRGLERNAA